MTGKIKILQIIKSLGRGGAEMLLPETLKLHNRDLFEFHYIYFLPWKDQLVDSIVAQGGYVVCVKANNNIQLMLRAGEVARYIRKQEIVLIHAHLPWAGILARIVGKMTGIPVLYTEHNKLERYHFATRLMNLASMNLLSGIVAVSGDVESSVRKYKRKLKAPLQTILNGVNTKTFVRDAISDTVVTGIKKQFGIPATACVIGTVAVFRFQKRLDIWLELASRIRSARPDTHFIIVGDGPLKAELVARCSSLGLSEYVHFAGLQTEVRPYVAAMDVYMMTSVFEGLPIALLEAMSLSRPIATTDAGGIKEVIRQGIDGFTVALERPDDLVAPVLRLLDDEALRKQMGARARQRVISSFSMETMVENLETLYRRILNR